MTAKTKVRCKGAMLTASFAAANPPLIWRFDLERNHSFTMALQGEEGDWELGITSPKGDFYPIAHFVAREDADESFVKVDQALSRRNGGFLGTVSGAIASVFIAALVVAGGVIALGMVINHPPRSTPIASAQSPAAPPPAEAGMPQSADDVLQPPSP